MPNILPLPAVPAEGARADVIHRELDDLAERLRPVRDPRGLAFAIVSVLVAWCGSHSVGAEYDSAHAEVALLLGLAKAASPASFAAPAFWVEKADRLAARFWGRVGPGGSWPWEYRIPFELAQALRRACEAEPERFLPLIVRDARAMLFDLGGDPSVVEDLITWAL